VGATPRGKLIAGQKNLHDSEQDRPDVAIGRPSVGPELMFRMLLVGYRYGVFVRKGGCARK
jgi:transposase